MKRSFEDWMASVDRQVSASVGLSADDLPDVDYYSLYESGATPASAAREAIQATQE